MIRFYSEINMANSPRLLFGAARGAASAVLSGVIQALKMEEPYYPSILFLLLLILHQGWFGVVLGPVPVV